MRNLLIAAAALATLSAGAANATTILDPAGDLLNHLTDADLDITSFSVTFDEGQQAFLMTGTMNGVIDPSKAGNFVVGINTGTGANHPFAGLGAPNVVFNQTVLIQKLGTAAISGHALTAMVTGDAFSVILPTQFLISTGFQPTDFGFSLWSRGAGNVIADFAPDNSTFRAVPEPASWALIILGFGGVGAALRRRRQIASGHPA